jgi:hypothetical protein
LCLGTFHVCGRAVEHCDVTVRINSLLWFFGALVLEHVVLRTYDLLGSSEVCQLRLVVGRVEGLSVRVGNLANADCDPGLIHLLLLFIRLDLGKPFARRYFSNRQYVVYNVLPHTLFHMVYYAAAPRRVLQVGQIRCCNGRAIYVVTKIVGVIISWFFVLSNGGVILLFSLLDDALVGWPGQTVR